MNVVSDKILPTLYINASSDKKRLTENPADEISLKRKTIKNIFFDENEKEKNSNDKERFFWQVSGTLLFPGNSNKTSSKDEISVLLKNIFLNVIFK